MPLKLRSQKPSHYSSYKHYKHDLRIEFEYRCVYCDVREPEIGGSKSFHIDHYAPRSKFPEKETEYSNLFYACRDCNTYKSDFWPSDSQNAAGQFILNPCDHDLEMHFNRKDEEWVATSPTANWNLEKLHLNSAQRLDIRKKRRILKNLIQRLEGQEKAIHQLLIDAIKEEDASELKKELTSIHIEIDILKSLIDGPLD